MKKDYNGKSFSILGDSISTLQGYTKKGYKLFYKNEICKIADVHTPSDTWWGIVLDKLGGELLVNNSWSGSLVSMVPNSKALFPSACSASRASGLHISNALPDVIIVYIGNNDWCCGVTPNRANCSDDFYSFEGAYNAMLQKIIKAYPNAEIWCCTICPSYISNNDSFVFKYYYGGWHAEDFNKVIRSVADKFGVGVIDLYKYHTPYDSIDGMHPNRDGMKTIASMVIDTLTNNKI